MSDSETAADERPDEQHKTLAEALLAAQAEMPAVERDQENPHFKSKFTSLDNLLAKARPVLNRHGLVLMQAPDLEDGAPVLRSIIMHSSGEVVAFAAPLKPAKEDPQGQGAAITYMRRYAAAAMLAIADQEDDDGGRPQAVAEQPERLTDERALALAEQARNLRDEIRAVDESAIPASSFDAAMSQREHSHERLEDFVGNLTEMLADVRRLDELAAEARDKLGESEAKKAIAKAARRASRHERVEVLEKALSEAKGGGEDGE